ncbi:MAG: signal peptidase II [Bacillota bacterium]
MQRGPTLAAAWALGAVAVDQAAKWAIARWIPPGESIDLVGRLVRLTHVTNPGAAFGLFEGRYELFVFATASVLVLAGVLATRFERPRSQWALAGIGLAAGGAAGNLIDRLRNGAVLDFIDVGVWPVFNLADTAIVSGVALLFWHLLRQAPQAVTSPSDGRSR